MDYFTSPVLVDVQRDDLPALFLVRTANTLRVNDADIISFRNSLHQKQQVTACINPSLLDVPIEMVLRAHFTLDSL